MGVWACRGCGQWAGSSHRTECTNGDGLVMQIQCTERESMVDDLQVKDSAPKAEQRSSMELVMHALMLLLEHSPGRLVDVEVDRARDALAEQLEMLQKERESSSH